MMKDLEYFYQQSICCRRNLEESSTSSSSGIDDAERNAKKGDSSGDNDDDETQQSNTTKSKSCTENVNVSNACGDLPPKDSWPFRPIYIQAASDTQCHGLSSDSVPIGVPVNFETSLFKGRILIRIRNIPKCTDAEPNAQTSSSGKNQFYFEDCFKNRRRMRQYTIQGEFKEPGLTMSDIYIGDFYKKPLGLVPPPSVDKVLRSSFQSLAPGLVMELSGDEPKVCVMMAGNVKVLSINKRGDEPDITQFDQQESTKLMKGDLKVRGKDFSHGGFKTPKERKKILSKPQHASKFAYEPGMIYTFTHYDDVFDLSTYSMRVPVVKKVDLKKILNSQPTTIRASTMDGRSVFNFNVFHECLI